QPLNQVPKWTGSVMLSYDVPIQLGDAFFRAQYGYTGQSFSFVNSPIDSRVRPAYGILDLRVGINHNRVETALYVDNATNKRTNLGDYISEYGELAGRPQYVINVPRTVGLQIVYSF